MQKKIFVAGKAHGNDVFSSQFSDLATALLNYPLPMELRELEMDPKPKDEFEIILAPPDEVKLGRYSILYTRWDSLKMLRKTVNNINMAFHVVVPTNWHKDLLVRFGVTQPITVIPTGATFQNTKLDPSTFQVGFIGSAEHAEIVWKCFKMAFPMRNRATIALVITSGTPFKTLDSRVSFLDQANSNFFASNSVLIELAGNEYWALQSMAAGRSVIGPNAGPLTDICPNFGIPCKEDNVGKSAFKFVPQMITDQLKNVYAMDRLPSADQIRARVETFTWQTCIDKLVDLARELRKVNILGGKSKETRTCIVQLGRYGDIFNILPVAKHIHDRDGVAPVFMVSKEYASVLDSVSYVTPHIFEGHYSNLGDAIEIANAHYSNVLVSQIYGVGFQITTYQPSFNTESWRSVGYLPMWDRLPLVLDRRNKDRENALLQKHPLDDKRRNILLNFTGYSSPFENSDVVIKDILFRWDHIINFIDLSAVRAEQIYDLLALMEKADGMITIDTATLHLAAACPIPYVALISSGPYQWHGSTPRGGCILGLRYNEVLMRRQEIHEAIHSLVQDIHKYPRYHHVWVDHPSSSEDEKRRRGVAEQTWKKFYESEPMSRPIPVLYDQLPRLFDDGKRRLPYVKDVIEWAFNYSLRATDLIILTNSDICFSEKFGVSLAKMLEGRDCAYCYRRDFKKVEGILSPKEIEGGDDYCGTDVFIFRSKWWRDNASRFPDMLMGCEAWDPVMRTLMHETDANTGIFKNLFYHQRHASVWEQPENRYSLPSQIHNLDLARGFFNERRIDPSQFGI